MTYTKNSDEAVQELEASLAMRCPQGRARSLALTKLDECAMWALRAVSEGGGEPALTVTAYFIAHPEHESQTVYRGWVPINNCPWCGRQIRKKVVKR